MAYFFHYFIISSISLFHLFHFFIYFIFSSISFIHLFHCFPFARCSPNTDRPDTYADEAAEAEFPAPRSAGPGRFERRQRGRRPSPTFRRPMGKDNTVVLSGTVASRRDMTRITLTKRLVRNAQLSFQDQNLLLEDAWCELFVLTIAQWGLNLDEGNRLD